MHALGMVLIWAALQVTVIFAMVCLLLWLAGKTEPLWRGKIILAGLLAACVVSALAVSPWPRWSDYWPAEEGVARVEPGPLSEPAEAPRDVVGPSDPASADALKQTGPDFESPWSAALSAFWEQVQKPAPLAPQSLPAAEPVQPAFTLGSLIAWLMLAGVGFGLFRLLAGLWILRREISRSPRLDEPRLTSAIQKIQGSSKPQIEIRLSNTLRSAATTGIVRPVILLPAGWTNWTEEELEAVLAHELHHIQRKDCLAALGAELVRVLHFYHPLMHWLANRLRLEQELAADAQAARHLGGQKRYLCILAEMALGESSRAPLWPARAFLPSHRTFMRRIEMLKKNHLTDRPASRFRRCAAFAVIAVATVFALGLRGPIGHATAQDKQATNESGPAETLKEAKAERQSFPLTYVPDDAAAVFGVRPKDLLEQPALKPLAEEFLKDEETAQVVGIPLKQVEQVVLSVGMRDTPRPELGVIATMVRSSEKLNLESLKKVLTPDSETEFYGGQLYLKQAGGQGPAFWLADEYTLIFSDSETGLKQAISARNLSVSRKNRIPAWKSVADEALAVYVSVGQVRKALTKQEMGGLGTGVGMGTPPRLRPMPPIGLNPMFGPLWSDVDTVVGRLSFGEGLELNITAHSPSEQQTARVKQTLDALLVLGRNIVDQNRQMISQLPERDRQSLEALLAVGQDVLKNVKVDIVRPEGGMGPEVGAFPSGEFEAGMFPGGEFPHSKVTIQAKLPADTAKRIIQAMTPAVVSARTAGHRTTATNQLKQFGLAMHNYYDVNGRFPAPVMIGPDGKTPHSWRVAILPYIQQRDLYEQYKFDEPWDSEHNKKLLEKIPAVYRHPLDEKDSTHTSFFALVGKNTLMGEERVGTQFKEITDGTSNTLMIVEAQRDIPWTRPEDIFYPEDRSKEPPKLGGWFKEGFLAVLGDGSVRFISKTIDKSTLQNLIERNDGNPLNASDLGVTRPPVGPGSRVPVRDSKPPGNPFPPQQHVREPE